MGRKNEKIAAIIEPFRGQDLPAQYLAYFECFNKELFFEAHEVLEEIWLPQRQQSNGLFYKGLIQLAGAFVHLQKERLRPAAALFRLARANISQYRDIHEQLDTRAIIQLIETWLRYLEADDFTGNPLSSNGPPKLALENRYKK